jgi:hypothetical protein
MGQAKRRGTFTDRLYNAIADTAALEQAQENNVKALSAMETQSEDGMKYVLRTFVQDYLTNNPMRYHPAFYCDFSLLQNRMLTEGERDMIALDFMYDEFRGQV